MLISYLIFLSGLGVVCIPQVRRMYVSERVEQYTPAARGCVYTIAFVLTHWLLLYLGVL